MKLLLENWKKYLKEADQLELPMRHEPGGAKRTKKIGPYEIMYDGASTPRFSLWYRTFYINGDEHTVYGIPGQLPRWDQVEQELWQYLRGYDREKRDNPDYWTNPENIMQPGDGEDLHVWLRRLLGER